MTGRRWTDAEILILKAYYHILPAKEIAKMLGRSERAVRLKAHKVGIANKRKGKPPLALTRLIKETISKQL